MGGGSLMTPILILIFGFKPSVAVGTDILHGAIFKSFGAARHKKLGTVNMRLAGWMLLGSAPMSLVGVALATWITHHYGARAQAIEGKILGVALVVGGIGFLIKSFVHGKENSWAPFPVETRDKLAAFGIGFFGGFIVGLTSVGSGTFFGLAMLLLFPLSAVRVVGTDIFQAAALLWVAGFGHMIAGNVNFHATGWLLVGSIPGVLIGSNVSVRMPERELRIALATTLMLSGIRLLNVPGAAYYIPITLVLVGLGLGWAWLRTALQSDATAGTGGSGQDTKGLPVSQQPSLYASQPVQNPVTAASSASAATIEPSTAPASGSPST